MQDCNRFTVPHDKRSGDEPLHPMQPAVASDSVAPQSTWVRLADTDIRWACRPGQSILDAAFQAGITLPYACCKGICALCATQVIQGEVKAVGSQPFTHPRCEPGQALMCQGTPASPEVVIRPARWIHQPAGTLRRMAPPVQGL